MFEQAYPVYTVITPQTGKRYQLRTLTVAEEKKLKGSLITPDKITEHVTSALFDCIVEKPEDIKTYEDFIMYTTTHDRQALLFGLFHVSYGEVTDFPIKCSHCGQDFKNTFTTESLAKITNYEGEESLLTKIVEVDLPITKLKAFVKQPTIRDEIITLKTSQSLPYQKDSIDDLVLVQKFTMGAKEWTDIAEKLTIYTKLPVRDKKLIWKAYKETFSQYTVEVKATAVCSFCKGESEIDIDFMEVFFRLVLE